jgi:hypothetical protein
MKILNDKPLYKYNASEAAIERIENEYSDKKVIRYEDFDGDYYDIPIEKNLTIDHRSGDIFFESLQVAEAFRHSIAAIENGGTQTLLENFCELSKRNEGILEFSEFGKVENGLYSVPGLDSCIPVDSWVHDLIYLDENNNIRKIKRPTPELDEYIVKYMRMYSLEKYDSNYERIIFEVYSEQGFVYINHFTVQDCVEPHGPIYTSRINNYVCFGNVISAKRYRRLLDAGAISSDHIGTKIISERLSCEEFERRIQKQEKIKEVTSIVIQFAIQHYNEILAYGGKALKKLKTSKNASKGVQEVLKFKAGAA